MPYGQDLLQRSRCRSNFQVPWTLGLCRKMSCGYVPFPEMYFKMQKLMFADVEMRQIPSAVCWVAWKKEQVMGGLEMNRAGVPFHIIL